MPPIRTARRWSGSKPPADRPPEPERLPYDAPAWATTRDAVLRRDRDCRLAFRRGCRGEHDPHHRWRRGQGGPDELWNLVRLCRAHHDWVHGHVLLAQSMGLLVPSWCGQRGCVFADALYESYRTGHFLFAPWLTEAEQQETVRQDPRWESSRLLGGWNP